jgi:hypothetical protein
MQRDRYNIHGGDPVSRETLRLAQHSAISIQASAPANGTV